ncbi:Microfibrillar-associated protein MFAP1 [Ceraceosorus bombacis]|uniref:Microfibrillar-associated protein MFAP1 n=1 Tax=Ceraceosorus bombacis TaxID=401625 RepID=A0A0P1BGG9_9BASI|nr:Microfibrillar-associated protein MFAP1 [Ceraceosorus bombacis]
MQPRAGQSRTQVARPAARYRPGKSLAGQADERYSSDERSSGDEAPGRASNSAQNDTGLTYFQVGPSSGIGSTKKDITLDLKDVRVGGEQAEEESEYETDTDEEQDVKAPGLPHSRAGFGRMPPTKKGSSEEYETDTGSDEEQSSEEEEKRPMMVKPIFVPKSKRTTTAAPPDMPSSDQARAVPQKTEESLAPLQTLDADALAEFKEAEKQKQRKLQSQQLAAQSIGRQLLEKAAAEAVPDLDDTDGLDPEEEFQSWRLRELERLARERSKADAAQAEKAEIERRRAMPSAQRDAEDIAHAEKTRQEKLERRREALALASADGGGESSSAVGAGGKYYHKGAFYQGGPNEDDEIFKRDYQGLTEGQVDMKLLPKVMQVKDYGKKGRSKYTNLKDQDTSRSGKDPRFEQRRNGEAGQGCFRCGGDHLKKDCPETWVDTHGRGPASRTSTGANSYRADGRRREWGGEVRDEERMDARLEGQREDLDRHSRHEKYGSRPTEREWQDDKRHRPHDEDRERDYGSRRDRSRERSKSDRHGSRYDDRSRDAYDSRYHGSDRRESRRHRVSRDEPYEDGHARKRRRSRSRSPQ